MNDSKDGRSLFNLGFVAETAKSGAILIYHHDRLATTLRGEKAAGFQQEVDRLPFAKQQQLMARITGNYKRGNERMAQNHPRNR